jgi:hypothetical protein
MKRKHWFSLVLAILTVILHIVFQGVHSINDVSDIITSVLSIVVVSWFIPIYFETRAELKASKT